MRKFHTVSVLAVAALTLGAVGSAGATEAAVISTGPTASKQHMVRMDLGFASALGLGGFNYGYEPSSWLRLEGGIGYGFTGLQLSVMPKFSVGSESHRFTSGAGVSLAFGSKKLIDVGSHVGAFVNVDAVGYEYRHPTGFTFSFSAGITVLAGGDTNYCFDGCGGDGLGKDRRGFVFPQGRIGFGYRF